MTESANTLFDVLKMAREIVNNEYQDKRAQDHNKWLADSETLWKTSKMKLPYPEYPPFPAEDAILERAKKLLEFVKIEPKEEIKQEPIPEVIMGTKEPEPVIEEQIIEQQKPIPEPPKSYSNNIIDYHQVLRSRYEMDEFSTTAGRLIPDLMKRIEEIRYNMTK